MGLLVLNERSIRTNNIPLPNRAKEINMAKAIRSIDKPFINASGEAVDGKLWRFFNCGFVTVYQVEKRIYPSFASVCIALVRNAGFSIEDAGEYARSLDYLNNRELL